MKTLPANRYYAWVYETVLNPKNQRKLDTLVHQFGLERTAKNSYKISKN